MRRAAASLLTRGASALQATTQTDIATGYENSFLNHPTQPTASILEQSLNIFHYFLQKQSCLKVPPAAIGPRLQRL